MSILFQKHIKAVKLFSMYRFKKRKEKRKKEKENKCHTSLTHVAHTRTLHKDFSFGLKRECLLRLRVYSKIESLT